ncbi:MAG: hypothetical protein JST59_00245 [Actinobacteria bacterium]|nr:hypothetical protein [Actinomycetota bacterium]
MSCSGQCGDIEDIADELFEFEEGGARPTKERKLKKVAKRKPEPSVSEEGDPDEVEFPVMRNVVPGTESIYVKTFGCSHNISDSEFMIGQLAEFGYNIVDSPEKADLLLVNSCTVKNPSQDAFMT